MQTFESAIENYNLAIAEYIINGETEIGVFKVYVTSDSNGSILSLSNIINNSLFGAIYNGTRENLTEATQEVRYGDTQYEYELHPTTVLIEGQVPLIKVFNDMRRSDLANLNKIPYSDIMDAVDYVKQNREIYGFNTPGRN